MQKGRVTKYVKSRGKCPTILPGVPKVHHIASPDVLDAPSKIREAWQTRGQVFLQQARHVAHVGTQLRKLRLGETSGQQRGAELPRQSSAASAVTHA